MNDRAHSIYRYACTYAEAAWLLNRQKLLLPSHVNAALALELYFKSLYHLEYGKDFKVKDNRSNEKNSHDFSLLFQELKDTVKQEIESDFDQMLKNRDMGDITIIETDFGVTIPRDMLGNLKKWSNVFVKFRYFYDYQDKAKWAWFFPEIENAIRNAIHKRKPEWQE